MHEDVKEITVKILLTAVLCGIIGLERGLRHKNAGLRTHILVGVGSALITLTSFYIFAIFKTQTVVDPTRMIAGIITGIGFLCAGTIIRGGTNVIGLTTAASLWIVSGIGMAVGCGQYVAASIVTVVVMVVLVLLRSVEKYFEKHFNNLMGGG